MNHPKNNQHETVEETIDFRTQVREEIGSLREKVDRILEALNVREECDPWVMMKEIERFPADLEKPIRWATIGGFREKGKGRKRMTYGILTGEFDDIFDNPDTHPEKVAEFIKKLAEVKLIDVCRQVFQGKKTRTELREACCLTDEELDRVIQPLLDDKFLLWREENGVQHLYEDGPGIRFMMTLIFMTRMSLRPEGHMPDGWSSQTGSSS